MSTPPVDPRAEAADPATPAERLELLAHDHDAAVRSAVARNPSAPVRILVRLATAHGEAVASNPVLPLLSLEHPGWFRACAPTGLQSLLRHGADDAALLEFAATEGSSEARALAAASPHAPTALLRMLLLDRSADVRAAAAQNPGAPRDFSQLVGRAGISLDVHGRGSSRRSRPSLTAEECRAIALERPFGDGVAVLQPACPDDVFARALGALDRERAHALLERGLPLPPRLAARLADHHEAQVRARVAARYETPVEVLARLARDSDDRVRHAVAANAATPAAVLADIAARAPTVPLIVASNPGAPPALLAALAAHENDALRAAAARNPGTPLPSLEALAVEKNPGIVKLLVENPAATPGVLARVASHLDERSRAYNMGVWDRALLEHLLRDPRTPPESLALLALLPCKPAEVAALLTNPATPAAALERYVGPRGERHAVLYAAHPSATPARLALASGHRDPAVRRAVAANRNTPASVLADLARDPALEVRSALATNPALPGDVAATLAGDSDPGVRVGVALHARLSRALFDALGTDPELGVRAALVRNPYLPDDLRAAAARSPDEAIRRAFARSPLADPALAHDASEEVRAVFAANALATPAQLTVLARDEAPDVMLAALRNANTPSAVLDEVARSWPDPSREVAIAGLAARRHRRPTAR